MEREKTMKRLIRLFAMLLCLSLVLAACGTSETSSSAASSSESASTATSSTAAESSAASSETAVAGKEGDTSTLVYAVNAEPGKIDPQNNVVLPGLMMERQLYDPLVMKDPTTGEIVPSLATEWEWVDDTHLQMKLREGVVFHDGTPFTAEDVKFTIGRFATGSATSSLYAPFDAENTEVVDDHTIIIAFSTPYAPALNFLTNPRALIVCKSWVEANGEEALNQNANGTGPFKFQEWIIGSSATFTRNENYWGEGASFETLVIRFIIEDSARMIALETGEIDMANGLQDADINRVLNGEVEGVHGFAVPGYKMWYLGFNDDFEPFQHYEVRQAIAHAVDWEAAVETAAGSTGRVATSSLASTVWGYVEQGIYEYDPELSKQLLAEAGYPDGFDVTIVHEELPYIIRLVEVIQQELAEVGINVTIQVVDTATWSEITMLGNADLSVGSMTANTGDPAHAYSQLVGSSANITFSWDDEEFNRLCDAGQVEQDEEKRAEIYAEVQKYVYETAGHIPMYEGVITYGARDYVEDFIPDAGSVPEMWHCNIIGA